MPSTKFRRLLVCTALAAIAAHAGALTIYDSARLVYEPAVRTLSLDGFGRVITPTGGGSAAASVMAMNGAPSQFLDRWLLGLTGVPAGPYVVSSFQIDATGALTFDAVTFNSINASGGVDTLLFGLNAARTTAVASGTFTALPSCPTASCVWVDVIGHPAPGGVGDGYTGSMNAALVPEPASLALMLAGLAALGAWVRTRQPAPAA